MVLGWLWGSGSSSNDTITKLDPSLQEVLKSQDSQTQHANLPSAPRPGAYTQQLRQSGQLAPSAAATNSRASEPHSHEEQQQPTDKPKVPPQSLFQDGRYAHIWKHYEPFEVVQSRGESEGDKLRRLQEQIEDRKVALGQAALENCVFEQMAEMDCLKNGGATAKLTLCRSEKKKFVRCYEMQVKFLKALGYWNSVGDPQRADRIQMHSDKLYQRLLEQDELMEKAREEGKPIPDFGSILSPENVSAVGGRLVNLNFPKQQPALDKTTADDSYTYPSIPKELRPSFEKRIEKMSQEEANVEVAVYLAEMEQKRQQMSEATSYLRVEGDARRKRFEAGEATIGDRIKRLTNWDAWDSRFPLPADAQARQPQQESQASADQPVSSQR